MSTVLVACPSCGKAYKLPSEQLGRQVRCKCGHAWTVPLAAPPAEAQSVAVQPAAEANVQQSPKSDDASAAQPVKPQAVKPQPVKPQAVKPQPVKPQAAPLNSAAPQTANADKLPQPTCVVKESPRNAAGVKAAARAADENSGAKANEEAKKLIGRELGNFRIDSLLGVGGFGAVYRAFDKSLHRDVALKVRSEERRVGQEF